MVITEQRLLWLQTYLPFMYIFVQQQQQKSIATKNPQLPINHNPSFWYVGL